MYVTSKASAKISNDFKIRKSNIHDAVNCLQHLLFRNKRFEFNKIIQWICNTIYIYILRKKSIWMPWSMCFVDIKCNKFWSIWLEHFVECKHLIYEECGPGTFWNKTGLQDGAAWVLHGRCVGGRDRPMDRSQTRSLF